MTNSNLINVNEKNKDFFSNYENIPSAILVKIKNESSFFNLYNNLQIEKLYLEFSKDYQEKQSGHLIINTENPPTLTYRKVLNILQRPNVCVLNNNRDLYLYYLLLLKPFINPQEYLLKTLKDLSVLILPTDYVPITKHKLYLFGDKKSENEEELLAKEYFNSLSAPFLK